MLSSNILCHRKVGVASIALNNLFLPYGENNGLKAILYCLSYEM